jgi:hypothetical protein
MPRLPAVTPRARARKRAHADARTATRRAVKFVAATVAAPVAAAQTGGQAVKEKAVTSAHAVARAGGRATELGSERARQVSAKSGKAIGAAGSAIRETALSARDWPAQRARANAKRRRRSRQRLALGTFAGLAAGYVLGARAGREQYEQLVAAARDFAGDPRVKQLTKQGGDTFRTTSERVGKFADRAAGSAADALRRRRERAGTR